MDVLSYWGTEILQFLMHWSADGLLGWSTGTGIIVWYLLRQYRRRKVDLQTYSKKELGMLERGRKRIGSVARDHPLFRASDQELLVDEYRLLGELEVARLQYNNAKLSAKMQEEKVRWELRKKHMPLKAQKIGLGIAAALLLFPGLRRRLFNAVYGAFEGVKDFFSKHKGAKAAANPVG